MGEGKINKVKLSKKKKTVKAPVKGKVFGGGYLVGNSTT